MICVHGRPVYPKMSQSRRPSFPAAATCSPLAVHYAFLSHMVKIPMLTAVTTLKAILILKCTYFGMMLVAVAV